MFFHCNLVHSHQLAPLSSLYYADDVALYQTDLSNDGLQSVSATYLLYTISLYRVVQNRTRRGILNVWFFSLGHPSQLNRFHQVTIGEQR